eukprot:TRINITY_DN67456_c13_g1_i1.p1 TRINITY_DN67456_c13_g1~~TRINITY_DN67456_c13_g1_i1.p1  ORF type:complete len:422 (-),score=20.57 TRINITY_DN67456_c13_g1_i1:104-1192(-)
MNSLIDGSSGGSGSEPDCCCVLELDVGGTEIHTSQTLLRSSRASDSMLGVWLSGEWSSYWEIERENDDGLIFIDRDGEAFRFILDWLRDGTDHAVFCENIEDDDLEFQATRNWSPRGREWMTNVRREAVYFGLSSLEQWCDKRLCLSPDRPVFTHVQQDYVSKEEKKSQMVDFSRGTFRFEGSTHWDQIHLLGLADYCLAPTQRGTATYFLKVLNPEGFRGAVGWACAREYGPQSDQVPLYTEAEGEEDGVVTTEIPEGEPHCCRTHCDCCKGYGTMMDANDWRQGDVVGVHLGMSGGQLCWWLSQNGAQWQAPFPLTDTNGNSPPPHHIFVPYASLSSGTVSATWGPVQWLGGFGIQPTNN